MWWIWVLVFAGVLLVVEIVVGTIWLWRKLAAILGEVCLLYTSDAADE